MMTFRAWAAKRDYEASTSYQARVQSASRQIQTNSGARSKAESDAKAADGKRQKILDLYSSRDMLQQVLYTIHACLPNEQNLTDPDQIVLHRAFREGDLATVTQMPRREREQVFLTAIKVVFTEDLSQNFDYIIQQFGGGRSSGGQGVPGMPGGFPGFPGYGGPSPFGGPNPFGGSMPGFNMPTMPQQQRRENSQEESGIHGFTVILEGYTPHKDNLAYLYPPDEGVALDRSRWGLFNRLRFIGKTDSQIAKELGLTTDQDESDPSESGEEASDPLPFETYFFEGAERLSDYFDYTENGWISTKQSSGSRQQPEGLGVYKEDDSLDSDEIRRTAQISREDFALYVDPFTGEPISQTLKRDGKKLVLDAAGQPVKENNDYWFRVKFKLKLKEQPEKE